MVDIAVVSGVHGVYKHTFNLEGSIVMGVALKWMVFHGTNGTNYDNG